MLENLAFDIFILKHENKLPAHKANLSFHIYYILLKNFITKVYSIFFITLLCSTRI
jgi:hypothetical protein